MSIQNPLDSSSLSNQSFLNPQQSNEQHESFPKDLAEIVISKLTHPQNTVSCRNACLTALTNKGIGPENFTEEQINSFVIDIAQELAENSTNIIPIIKQFEFDSTSTKDQQRIIDLVKSLAQKDGSSTLIHIKKFGINASSEQGRRALIEIAKLCFLQSIRLCTISFFHNLGFDINSEDGHQALTEMVRFCAQHNPRGTCMELYYFGFDSKKERDRQVLLEVVKTCAHTDALAPVLYIRNFDFDVNIERDRIDLLDIFCICAQKDPKAVLCINNFGFDPVTKKQVLLEISEDCAKKNGGMVASHIDRFEIDHTTIEGQQKLVKIAMLCAQENGEETAKHIANFKINTATEEDKQAIFEIAKLCAQQNGGITAKYIQNFGFNPTNKKEQTNLIEIAKLCITQNTAGTIPSLRNFEINPKTEEGQIALIEMLKLSAQRAPERADVNLSKFSIENNTEKGREALIFLVKQCLDIPAVPFTTFLQIIENDQLMLLAYAWMKHPNLPEINSVASYLDRNRTSVRENVSRLVLRYYQTCQLDQFQDAYDQFKDVTKNYWPKLSSNSFDNILNKIKEERDPILQKQKLMTLMNYIVTLATQKISDEKIEKLLDIEAFSKIMDVRNPELRLALIEQLTQVCKQDVLWESFITNTSSATPSYQMLSYLFSVSLFPNPKDAANFSNQIGQVGKTSKTQPLFKDRFVAQSLLTMLNELNKTDIPAEDKKYVLKELIKEQSNEIKKSVKLIRSLILCGFKESLSEDEIVKQGKEKFCDALSQIFSNKFQETFPMREGVDHVTERYEQTVAQFRDPNAIFTYLGSIKKLSSGDKERLIPLLSTYVEKVLTGTFNEWRYDSTDNPHLEAFDSKFPNLKPLWETDSSSTISTLLGTNQALGQSSLDFKNYLFNSFDQKHVEEGKFQSLKKYLFSNDIDEKKEIRKELTQQIKDASKDEKILINFQLKGMQLTETNDNKQAMRLLEEMSKSPSLTGVFKDDIIGWKKSLSELSQKASQPFGDKTVCESSDPFDLLVCGTEVAGSCQKIDGDPHLNKCLLGYVVNGQNKLIVVKKADGQIESRAIFQKLIDKNGNPCLFLQRIYPVITTEENKLAIEALAKIKAEALGLPLLSKEVGRGKTYGIDVESLGGRAPYEYNDASDGVCKNGIYTIMDCHVLFTPNTK